MITKKHNGQTGRVLAYLQQHGKISSMQSFELFGATRLSSIIFELRKDGYNIDSQKKDGVNRYGEPVHYVDYVLGA